MWEETQVLQSTPETPVNWSNELLKPENSDDAGVLAELEKNKLIKEYGGLDVYSSMKLLEILETAVAPDNKWVLHVDYRTRLKTLELILKLQDKNFNSAWVSINFFSSPKELRH